MGHFEGSLSNGTLNALFMVFAQEALALQYVLLTACQYFIVVYQV